MCNNCGSAMVPGQDKCTCCGSLNGKVIENGTNRNTNQFPIKAILIVFVIIFLFAFSSIFFVFNGIKSTFNSFSDGLMDNVDDIITDTRIEYENTYDNDFSIIIEKYRDSDVDWYTVINELVSSDEVLTEDEFEMIIIDNINEENSTDY